MPKRKSQQGTFWTFGEMAETMGVSVRTIRQWVHQERLCEFRLHKTGRNRIHPVVTTDQFIKLMDAKRPVFGRGSAQEALWNDYHNKRIKAGHAANFARTRKTKEATTK